MTEEELANIQKIRNELYVLSKLSGKEIKNLYDSSINENVYRMLNVGYSHMLDTDNTNTLIDEVTAKQLCFKLKNELQYTLDNLNSDLKSKSVTSYYNTLKNSIEQLKDLFATIQTVSDLLSSDEV